MDAIKCCPFCGSEASLFEAYSEGWYQVECVSEECHIECKTISCYGRQDAIDTWNKRA